MTKATGLDAGDKVSWKWGAGQPSGTVEEVVEGDASITTKKGNSVSRHGGEQSREALWDDRTLILLVDEDNPAVKIKADSGVRKETA
jgi:hypothetical protein